MQKKVEDILEAFEHHRFEDALRQIDQLQKKVAKDNKKKNVLTNNDQRTLQMVKGGCLASLGKIHEANQVLLNYFTEKVLSEMTDKEKFMFVSILQMAQDEKKADKVQHLTKTSKDARLDRFLLSHRLFSTVSKTFLKEYATEKREEDGLAQIFLEYLNELNKLQPVQNYFSKDLLIQANDQLKIKMVEMFFMKYFSTINLAKLKNLKLKSSIIDLRIRLAIHSGNDANAKKFYLENLEDIKQNFVYLRSIRQMPQNQTQNYRFYIENCGIIFRRNLQIQSYVPLYDFYNEFLDLVISNKITTDLSIVKKSLSKPECLSAQKLYDFKDLPNEQVLSHYFNSLAQQLKALTEESETQSFKNSDYYKISIKGLMLQLLRIMFEVESKTSPLQESQKNLENNAYFCQILESYYLQFAKTLTFTNELKQYFPFLKTRFEKILEEVVSSEKKYTLPTVFKKADDNLILLINAIKLLVVVNKDKLSDWKETKKWVELCWGFYQQFIEEIQQSKRRQKGEVFLSDEFVTLLSDLLVYHIENLSNFQSTETQSFIESILLKLMSILDSATELSPFNGYLKLRLMYVCQKLNYIDNLLDTYTSLDIKSVQFETLGYFFITAVNRFNLYPHSEERLTRMVRSYQENQRETSEYCLKGLKAGTTHQVFEYFSYQKRLGKSFSKLILFYTLYLKYQRKEHSEFYLQWIENNLAKVELNKQKISFNCDTKTMQNTILSLSCSQNESDICPFNEYYGYLNSSQVFKLQLKFRKLESFFRLAAKAPENEKVLDQLLSECENGNTTIEKSSNLSQLYDLPENFSILKEYLGNQTCQQPLTTNPKETFTFSKTKHDLLLYIQTNHLKLKLFKFFNSLLKTIKLTENPELHLASLKQNFAEVLLLIEQTFTSFNEKHSWREQVRNVWLLRETLFTQIHIAKAFNEEAGSMKKLPKAVKNCVSEMVGELEKVVVNCVTNVKFSESLKCDTGVLSLSVPKGFEQKNAQRDQILRRISSMSQKQAKDLLAK